MLAMAPASAGPLQCVAVSPFKKLEIPKSGSELQMGFLVLQIANMSGKPVLIDLFAEIAPRLRLPDGRVITPWWQQDDSTQPSKSDFVFLNAGRSFFMSVGYGLTGGRQAMVWSGSSQENRSLWAFKDLPAKPGRYQISLVYRPMKRDFPASVAGEFHGAQPWYGEIETKPVSIEIVN